jgi:hypothetical protein
MVQIVVSGTLRLYVCCRRNDKLMDRAAATVPFDSAICARRLREQIADRLRQDLAERTARRLEPVLAERT